MNQVNILKDKILSKKCEILKSILIAFDSNSLHYQILVPRCRSSDKGKIARHVTQYIMLGLSSWFWWSQRNVEFVGQNRCGPQHRKIINDGNRFLERRASSSRSVCKISGETARILSECMRVVLVNKTVTYFNLFVGYFKQCDMSVMTKVPNFII